MNRSQMLVSAAAVLVLATVGLAPAAAQEEAEKAAGGDAPAVTIRPMEIYGCVFREGQGMAQLAHVAGRWNAWMDSTGQNDYWAYTLAPIYYSSEFTFDVLWAGGWPSGAAMGSSLERWITQGGELQAEFARVVDCTMVANFAVMDLSENPEPPANGPVSFSNCKIAEGKHFPEAVAAMRAWIAYEAEHGIASDNFVLFPAFGETADADYSFKWVTTSSWAAFGRSYDQYGTGGGWMKNEELFGGLLDCDSSRIYQATRVRAVAMPE